MYRLLILFLLFPLTAQAQQQHYVTVSGDTIGVFETIPDTVVVVDTVTVFEKVIVTQIDTMTVTDTLVVIQSDTVSAGLRNVEWTHKRSIDSDSVTVTVSAESEFPLGFQYWCADEWIGAWLQLKEKSNILQTDCTRDIRFRITATDTVDPMTKKRYEHEEIIPNFIPIMAFPTVKGVLEYEFARDVTDAVLDLTNDVNGSSITVASGELILIIGGTETTDGTDTSAPTGFTELYSTEVGTSDGSHFGYYKEAAGGETSISIPRNTNTTLSAHVYVIQGWNSVEAATPVDLNFGTSLNPPLISPSWGADDTVWIVTLGLSDDNQVPSSAPTNYSTNLVTTLNPSGSSNLYQTFSSSWRENNATSEDPDAWGHGGQWAAGTTIAIQPGSKGSSGTSFSLSGTATSFSDSSGLAVSSQTLAGSGTGQSSATGNAGQRSALAGTGTTQTTGQGFATQQALLSGIAESQSAGSGNMLASITVSGTGTSFSGGFGNLSESTLISLAGTVISHSSASGSVKSNQVLSGNAVSNSSSSGNIVLSVDLVGSAASQSAGSGNLVSSETLSGNSISFSDANGSLASNQSLSGDAVSFSFASGNITEASATSLSGTAVSFSGASGVLSQQSSLAGTGTSLSEASANLLMSKLLSGDAISISGGNAAALIQTKLSGTAISISSGSGNLGTGIPAFEGTLTLSEEKLYIISLSEVQADITLEENKLYTITLNETS